MWIGWRRGLGIGTGNPGVFQGYPYPYPSLPVPSHWGTVFDGYGCRVAAGTGVQKPVHGFVFINRLKYLDYSGTFIESQSSANSSSFPSTAGKTAAAFTSLSCTYPNTLHTPTHRSARVDWTDSRLRMWESSSRPWLNVRSTWTDVAEKDY